MTVRLPSGYPVPRTPDRHMWHCAANPISQGWCAIDKRPTFGCQHPARNFDSSSTFNLHQHLKPESSSCTSPQFHVSETIVRHVRLNVDTFWLSALRPPSGPRASDAYLELLSTLCSEHPCRQIFTMFSNSSARPQSST
jgi:hypothetical protein